MKFDIDINHIPSTFDAVHVGLAALSLILLLLLVILLSLVVIGLLRKSNTKTVVVQPPETVETARAPSARTPAPKPVKPKPAALAEPEPPKPAPPPAPVILRESTPDAALQLLGLLQQEARFVDFIEESIASHSDADIGAAVRLVHEGCHKVLHTHFNLKPVRSEQENSRIRVPKGFDASSIRLTGNIVGNAPFNGTLIHRGWQIDKIKLPKLTEGHNVNIIAAAEVEL